MVWVVGQGWGGRVLMPSGFRFVSGEQGDGKKKRMGGYWNLRELHKSCKGCRSYGSAQVYSHIRQQQNYSSSCCTESCFITSQASRLLRFDPLPGLGNLHLEKITQSKKTHLQLPCCKFLWERKWCKDLHLRMNKNVVIHNVHIVQFARC